MGLQGRQKSRLVARELILRMDELEISGCSSGRDASHNAPPGQIRTSGFPAYGSQLGCRAVKRVTGYE